MDIIKQAIAFHKKADYKNAEKLYLQFLDKNPKEAKALHLLGAMYMQMGKYDHAIDFLEKAFNLDKDTAIKTDYALCLYEIKNYEKSLNLLLELLNGCDNKILHKKALDCAFNLKLGKKYLKIAVNYLENFEDDIFVLRNAAGLAFDLNNLILAKKYYEKIFELCKDDFIACNNLALIYEFQLDFINAEKYYKKAIEIKPNRDPIYNLSVLLRRQGRFAEALKYLDLSKEYGLSDIAYDCGIGHILLSQKDFSGFKPYLNFIKYRHFFLKNSPWDGKPDKNTVLLLCATEGYGDIFMFSRYLDFVNVNLFKDVILAVPEAVLELFAYNFPDFKVVNAEGQIPYDVSDIIMNLPNVYGLDFEHIPSADKYLMVPPLYLNKWKEYFDNNKINVGIFYTGNYLDKRSLRNRCINFKLLEPLFNLKTEKEIRFYSLQPEKEFAADIEIQNAKTGNIEALYDKIENFSDTAAIIENLDLIISIDSSVANLAGALGKETYLLLPKCADWRWFNDDCKTAWYNSIQIFRQEKEGIWETPVKEIVNVLQNKY